MDLLPFDSFIHTDSFYSIKKITTKKTNKIKTIKVLSIKFCKLVLDFINPSSTANKNDNDEGKGTINLIKLKGINLAAITYLKNIIKKSWYQTCMYHLNHGKPIVLNKFRFNLIKMILDSNIGELFSYQLL